MSINFGPEPGGNGNGTGEPFVRMSAIARHLGTGADILREAATENSTALTVRKDSAGKWEMAISDVPKLVDLLQKRGLRVEPAMLLFFQQICHLEQRVRERETEVIGLKQRQSSLERENKSLREETVRLATEGAATATGFADSAMKLAEKAISRPATVPPIVIGPSGLKAETDSDEASGNKPWTFEIGGLHGRIPRVLIPFVAIIAAFFAGMWINHLQSEDQWKFYKFAGDNMATTMKTFAQARERAENSLSEEKKQLAQKEQELKASETQQKDISDQLNQRKIELAALGTEKRNLTEKVDKLQEQVKLLEGDRTRRDLLEKQLQETLEAQKKVNSSQSDVITAQRSELDALKKQLATFTSKTADSTKADGPAKNNKSGP